MPEWLKKYGLSIVVAVLTLAIGGWLPVLLNSQSIRRDLDGQLSDNGKNISVLMSREDRTGDLEVRLVLLKSRVDHLQAMNDVAEVTNNLLRAAIEEERTRTAEVLYQLWNETKSRPSPRLPGGQ